MRQDIPLADQIVQIGHACLDAGNQFGKANYLVVFGVSSKDKLIQALESTESHGIKAELFYEPDDEMGYTAFCTEPVQEDQRKHFKKYQLWK